MLIRNEQEMIDLGRTFAQNLQLPAVFELIGDVGAGKTTFTRGLAEGLQVSEAVTSPSFTISKRYAFPVANQQFGELIHYDFYRLDDPGIMRDELSEALAEPNSVIIVEWGGDVSDLLPTEKYQLQIQLNADGSRTVNLNKPAQDLIGGNQ